MHATDMRIDDQELSTAEREDARDEAAADEDAPLAAESRERQAALARGAASEQEQPEPETTPLRVQRSGPSLSRITDVAFRALAENVRDYAIFLMNPDGVITFWGEGARLMKWWTKAQAEGSHLRLLYPDGGSADGTAEAHLVEAAERGEYSGEGDRVRSDGSTFWAGITLTALRDEDRRLLGFAKVTRDLTARRAADALMKAASDAAEQARRAAELANRSKSQFLATMSHEIRTPINAVLGYLELLDLEVAGSLSTQQRGFVSRARSSGQHLLGIIDEILDLSRLEAGRVAVGRRAARLGTAIEGAITLVAPQLRSRDIQLVNAVNGLAANLTYWGDDTRVRQILVNLLSNALKFTGKKGRITVSAGTGQKPSPDARVHGEGPWVYVRVEDTGEGISQERLGAVFEPFVQADMTLTREHGGTGLGLAISRWLARLMGGDITVRSEPGVGSSFFVWLPAAPLEAMRIGGVEGEPPPENYEDRATDAPADETAAVAGTLRDVAEATLAELERILHVYVARLRTDPATPSAHRLAEEELEDHLATFLADVGQTLASIDVATSEPSESLRDSTAIQRVIAERHGRQRARLGWSEDELRREYRILGEELAAAVRRRAPQGNEKDAERAREALDKFIAHAERIGLESLREARGSAV